jgi:Zn-finger nucleic acid-binding protein
VSKKTNIILDIDDSEMNLFKKQYINAAEVREEIEKLEYEEDKLDKRKKEYKLWKEKMNFLIDMYNVKVGWKAYKKLE